MEREDELYPTPDMEWYAGISDRRGTSIRCPFASVGSCPRFYASLSLLGRHGGSTPIVVDEDKRLEVKWTGDPLWPRTDEYDTSVSGNEHKCFSNFCPEALYDRFGYFVTSIGKAGDEYDMAARHDYLRKINAPRGHPLWSWNYSIPQHFTQCHLYPQLLRRESIKKEATESVESARLDPKFGILFAANQVERDFDRWKSEGQSVSGYSIALIFLDIDDFKKLNTQFLESVVDRTVLPDFQKLILNRVMHRGSAYKYGGEEIVVLLPNVRRKEAMIFAEDLRATINEHDFVVDGIGLRISVSIGVAMWPDSGPGFSNLLEAANAAEHQAKLKGKNRVHDA